jgi:magnesium-transporting ATPase (P-type)
MANVKLVLRLRHILLLVFKVVTSKYLSNHSCKNLAMFIEELISYYNIYIKPQLIEIRWFGKWAEFRNMSLIHAWKGHMSNSVHHITNGIIIHIKLPNLHLK